MMCQTCHVQLTCYNCDEGDFFDGDADFCSGCEKAAFERAPVGGFVRWCTDVEFERYEKSRKL